MKTKKLSPLLIIILSYIAVIFIGSVLLLLPAAMENGESMGFIDALFMSASSICVTGLSSLSNLGTQLSLYGKIVTAILMEVGGLGFITYAMFFMVLIGSKIGISDRMLVKESLNLDSGRGIVKNLLTIVLVTLGFQFIGAVIVFFTIKGNYETLPAIGISIFHAISAFNNVGLDIFGYGDSIAHFTGNIPFNIITMLLIIFGGFGFLTMKDLFTSKKWTNFTITTKIILITLPILTLGGALLLKIVMGSNITFLEALSLSVSSRTAGFAIIDLNTLNGAAYVLIIVLMFIGGAPCSIAGGIKVTTAFVIVTALLQIRKGDGLHLFKRRINEGIVLRAFCLATFGVLFIAVTTFIICAIEGAGLMAVLMEVVSAFGTVGFSLGLTPLLSPLSKIIIIFIMFIGKLGPLAIMSLWNKNLNNTKTDGIDYPEGKILIG